jgi:hypothetical protein
MGITNRTHLKYQLSEFHLGNSLPKTLKLAMAEYQLIGCGHDAQLGIVGLKPTLRAKDICIFPVYLLVVVHSVGRVTNGHTAG